MQQSQSTHKQKQGFSLIELLVVMAIIAILMGLVAGVSGVVTRKSAVAQARAQISELMNEIELYRADVGTYPSSYQPPRMTIDVMVLEEKDDPSYDSSLTTNKPGFMDWYEDKYPDTVFNIVGVVATVIAPTDADYDPGDYKYFTDTWGRPIVYEYTPDSFVYLIGSTGANSTNGTGVSPDNVFGRGDDLTNRNGAL